MAPIKMAGITMTMQPMEAKKDSTWAFFGVLQDKTRWKYTCQGIPPQIYREIRENHSVLLGRFPHREPIQQLWTDLFE